MATSSAGTAPGPSRGKLQRAVDGFFSSDRVNRAFLKVLEWTPGVKYEYEPLPSPTHIRLIYIHPWGEDDQNLRCSIRLVDLNEKPMFKALSYTWNKDKPSSYEQPTKISQTPRQTLEAEHNSLATEVLERYRTSVNPDGPARKYLLTCNERFIQVEQNLLEALYRLRLEEPEEYWIDAICINQNDDDERTAQVQMMGRIFSEAKEVIVWLGLPSFDFESALQQFAMERREKQVEQTGAGFKTSLQRLMSNVDDYTYFLWLFEKGWFRRVWVIQEYCLARQIVFHLGRNSFSNDFIEQMASSIEMNPAYRHVFVRSFLPQGVSTMTTTLPGIQQMLRMRKASIGGHKWNLEQWLEILKGRIASDVRDAIFAGLSLINAQDLNINQGLQLDKTEVNEGHKIGPGEGPGLEVRLWPIMHANYGSDEREVLINLAACILTTYGWELMFQFVLRLRFPPHAYLEVELPLSSQPSWVPDPSPWTSHILEPGYMFRNNLCPFPAHESAIAMPRISADGSTLLLNAVEIDSISGFCNTFGIFEGSNIDAWLDLFEFAIQELPLLRASHETQLCIFFRVLTSYGYYLTNPQNHIDAQILVEDSCKIIDDRITELLQHSHEDFGQQKGKRLRDLYARFKQAHDDAPWRTEVQTDIGDQDSIENPAGGATSVMKYLWSTASNNQMRCFTTKTGYLGMGPAWLDVGDRICLIPGGSTPFIFADINDVLKRRIEIVKSKIGVRGKENGSANISPKKSLKGKLRGMTGRKPHLEELKREKLDLEARIGRRDSFLFVGEAYVEGVMYGEIAPTLEHQLKRLEIV